MLLAILTLLTAPGLAMPAPPPGIVLRETERMAPPPRDEPPPPTFRVGQWVSAAPPGWPTRWRRCRVVDGADPSGRWRLQCGRSTYLLTARSIRAR